MNKTLVVFHRCGGKSLNYPPNTILTAQWAAKNGARAIEYDVAACNNGGQYKIIVIEPKLLKKANLDINSLRWEDVKKLNAGNDQYGYCKVPILEEMLAVIDNALIGHQIHIKGSHPATVKTLLPKLQSLKNYLITSFDITVVKQVKDYNKSTPVGWIVKPKQESGGEGSDDLTAAVTAKANSMSSYSGLELSEIIKEAVDNLVDVVILCAPRIYDELIITKAHGQGLQIGAWGVGTNLDLARKLIKYQLDRFTLDNPEQLFIG